MAGVLSILPTSLIAVGMFFVNVIINFFVPSGRRPRRARHAADGALAQMTGVTMQDGGS